MPQRNGSGIRADKLQTKIGITTVSFPAVVSIPVLTVFTFAVSMLGAFIADHILVLRKIVMLH